MTVNEKGRYLNIPREERLCNACHDMEGEIHFLDKCIAYSQIKITTVKHYIRVKLASNVTKSSDLFLFNDMRNVFAKYVVKCSSLSPNTSHRNHDYVAPNNSMGYMTINVLVLVQAKTCVLNHK